MSPLFVLPLPVVAMVVLLLNGEEVAGLRGVDAVVCKTVVSSAPTDSGFRRDELLFPATPVGRPLSTSCVPPPLSPPSALCPISRGAAAPPVAGGGVHVLPLPLGCAGITLTQVVTSPLPCGSRLMTATACDVFFLRAFVALLRDLSWL